MLTESPDHVLQNDIIICPYLKSLKFFRAAILEQLRSHFAKIAHKVAKPKYFFNIQNESCESLREVAVSCKVV